MDREVTLTLPVGLYENAKRWARFTRRDLSETLKDALIIVLTPVYTSPALEKPISSLPDKKVLALCKTKIHPLQGRKLSRLLKKQGEGTLTQNERAELLAVMQVYQQLWIRQSEALAEAVRRGLRASLVS